MESDWVCPFCRRRSVMRGHFMTDGISRTERHGLFAPEDLKRSFLGSPRTIVVGPDTGFLCLNCGMVWGQADLAGARTLVEQFGSDELKSLLASSTDA